MNWKDFDDVTIIGSTLGVGCLFASFGFGWAGTLAGMIIGFCVASNSRKIRVK